MLSFLDALASLGSVLESHSVSQSVGNVFEILSNLGHIIRLSSGYLQGMFRVGSEFDLLESNSLYIFVHENQKITMDNFFSLDACSGPM